MWEKEEEIINKHKIIALKKDLDESKDEVKTRRALAEKYQIKYGTLTEEDLKKVITI